MKAVVSIGTRTVPLVLGSGVSELYFTGGEHGKKEAGYYRFWTCVGADKFGDITVIGRARRSLDAGDRIARMVWRRTAGNPPAHRKIYARMYKLMQKHAHYVRPSTEREVDRWARSHKGDMKFARESCVIRGKHYKRRPRPA